MSLPGGIRLDANTFLWGCRGSGKGGFENREGAKPPFCFSSSDLALLAEPSGTMWHSHSLDGLQHPDGETKAGQDDGLMWTRT